MKTTKLTSTINSAKGRPCVLWLGRSDKLDNSIHVFCLMPGDMLWEETWDPKTKQITSSSSVDNPMWLSVRNDLGQGMHEVYLRAMKRGAVVVCMTGCCKAFYCEGDKQKNMCAVVRWMSCYRADLFPSQWTLRTRCCINCQKTGNVEWMFGLERPGWRQAYRNCSQCYYAGQSPFDEPCRSCGNDRRNFVLFLPDASDEPKDGLEPCCAHCAYRDLPEDAPEWGLACGACNHSYPRFLRATYPEKDRECDTCRHRHEGKEGPHCKNCIRVKCDIRTPAKPEAKEDGCSNCTQFQNSQGCVICNNYMHCREYTRSNWEAEPCASCKHSMCSNKALMEPCRSCMFNYTNKYEPR